MILSVSRRTDIPNYYSDWFLNRIREGYLYVVNPMNPLQVSRIDLSPRVIDCIVFWTKNPANMLDKLEELKDYKYYFQFTLTGYGKEVEPGVPDKKAKIIPTFIELSQKLGKERVIWRYDPIFLSEKYTQEYHLKAFETIAGKLDGYTERVIISFVDLYKKIQTNVTDLHMIPTTDEDMRYLAGTMVKIAEAHHMVVESCAEKIDLEDLGVKHGSCIDKALIERIIGCKISVDKDKNQRPECGCFASVEVGTYNTCLNGCKYCYANLKDHVVRENAALYDKNSPLLCAKIKPEAKITQRKMESCKEMQLDLFDL